MFGKKTNVIRRFRTIFDPFRKEPKSVMTVLIMNGDDHAVGELNMPEGVFQRDKEYEIVLIEKERGKNGK